MEQNWGEIGQLQLFTIPPGIWLKYSHANYPQEGEPQKELSQGLT